MRLNAFLPYFSMLSRRKYFKYSYVHRYSDTSFIFLNSLSKFEMFILKVLRILFLDRLCDPMVRVHGHRSRGLGSIPGTTRFSEK
jgi:hypothetical protein